MSDANTLPIFRANFDLVIAITQLTPAAEHKEIRTLIEDHIERWSNSTRIVSGDFEPGLQWFNVQRPLSMAKDLRGKIVVLDFFTYCCVNCQHVLPDLKELERLYSVEDGVVVVGVHSPKFDHEKDSSSVLNAVLRNEIAHPVVNDPSCKLWQMLFVNCWPTLVILGPEGQILFIFMGEGHRIHLFKSVTICLEYFKAAGRISAHSLPTRSERDATSSSILSYPGKICLSHDGSHLAIADSGHHRIVIASNVGLVTDMIGKGEKGFQDGDFSTATFSSPQGICWSRDALYVCDTDNHAIRKVDLIRKTVVTVAGNGQMGSDEEGGAIGPCQGLNSPWDCCLVNSSASPPQDPDVLLIAMSGCHQIWMLALRNGVRWYKRDETFPAGACVRLYGSGQEEHRNNMYAFKAGFAQPSGLAFDPDNMLLYVADSESSAIRVISLLEGSVKNVVGASRDPTDLFTFGDTDGAGGEVRLQHPLAVAYSRRLKRLLVADSYNHKIKTIDTVARSCKTLLGDKQNGDTVGAETKLDEPGGLCIAETENQSVLFVCDTNNHCIKAVDLNTNVSLKIPMIYRPELAGKSCATPSQAGGPSIVPIIVNCNPITFGLDQPVLFNMDLVSLDMIDANSKIQWKLLCCNKGVMDNMEITDATGAALCSSTGTVKSSREHGFLQLKIKPGFPKDIQTFIACIDVTSMFCDKRAGICVPKHMRFVLPCRVSVENSKKECTGSVDLRYLVV
ncbi:NHL repeat-containing protein 2 [Hypsibius exemplaris]|uniref:NHL repeat-containing protein 2 n=1 Tax=Hypsibius exemplaris TaxID=2072580 RepID=A0A1W0WA79_HYPEX|nr:NHL repeat-containing protein 2 [Hypsibius exemplaris]